MTDEAVGRPAPTPDRVPCGLASTWTLGSAIVGDGLLALAMTPMTTAWGLAGLWIALTAGRLLVPVTQTVGFMRHSARAQ